MRRFVVYSRSRASAWVLTSYLFIDTLSGELALAVVGTALVIAFGQHGLCNKLLSQRTLVYIGKISYSLYLWHWPVLVLAKHLGFDWPGVADKVVLVCTTSVLAIVTYHLIEKPTRRRNGIVPAIMTSGVLVAAAALGMAVSPRFYDTSPFSKGIYVVHNCHPGNPTYDHNPRLFATTLVDNHSWTPNAYCTEGIRIGDPTNDPDVVLLGDSHGCMWSGPIRTVLEELGIPGTFFCIDGCGPFLTIPPTGERRGFEMTADETLQFDRARLECLEKWKPKLVIVAARWKLSLPD